jgi:hypothetical protein
VRLLRHLDDVVGRLAADDGVHQLERHAAASTALLHGGQLLVAGPGGVDERVPAGAVHHHEVLRAELGLGDGALERRLALGLGHVAHDDGHSRPSCVEWRRRARLVARRAAERSAGRSAATHQLQQQGSRSTSTTTA